MPTRKKITIEIEVTDGRKGIDVSVEDDADGCTFDLQTRQLHNVAGIVAGHVNELITQTIHSEPHEGAEELKREIMGATV